MIERFNYTDKSFDTKDIENYHLSLQVYPKGFSFCILDRVRNKYIALAHYYYEKIVSYAVLMDEIEKVYQESEVLQHPYQHIKLLFATPKSTLVPGAFFDENNPESFFNFNHELKKNEKVYANYIYGNESHIVYSLPDVVSNYFLGRYPQIRIYHQACPFIDELLLKNKAQSDFKSVYLNIYPAFFDVAWLHNAELQLFNSFAYRNLVDFQYFLLNVFEQLKLSVVDIPVIITGFVQKNDPKVEMIRKYFKKVDYLEHPDHFSYAYGFNEHPNHYFTNMLNLYQCG